MTETRADVYSRITDQIAAAIAAGTTDWRLPWHHDGQSTARPMNLASKRAYRGINVLALWIAADAGGFSNGLWGTYRQWLAQGAQVRKGERGTTVVLWKQSGSQSDDDHGNDDDRPGRRVFARAFTVFNVAQVDGYAVEVMDERSEPGRFAHADAFIANLGIRTVYGGNGACYLPVAVRSMRMKIAKADIAGLGNRGGCDPHQHRQGEEKRPCAHLDCRVYLFPHQPCDAFKFNEGEVECCAGLSGIMICDEACSSGRPSE